MNCEVWGDLPRKIDRRCIRWERRRGGVVAGLPDERISVKVVERRKCGVREGICGSELTVRRGRKKTPCDDAHDGEQGSAEECCDIVLQEGTKFHHGEHLPFGDGGPS